MATAPLQWENPPRIKGNFIEVMLPEGKWVLINPAFIMTVGHANCVDTKNEDGALVQLQRGFLFLFHDYLAVRELLEEFVEKRKVATNV